MILSFDKIVGHERPIQVLQTALSTGRVPHAYLFAGAQGIGKRTCALAFAAALNCETGAESACGKCQSCRKILGGNHPDLIVVEPTGQFIKIDQVRQVSKLARSSPYEGRYRVIVFDGADALNPSAANALLKTLEEPGKNMVLVLVTANPEQLLPTVLSRCQRINFNPLSPEQIETVILEQIESDPQQARLLARLSEGSLGWVLRADLETVVDRRRDLLSNLIDLDGNDEAALAAFADQMLEGDADPDTTFEMIRTFLRDAALLAAGADPDRVINVDLAEGIQTFASRYPIDRLLSMGHSVGYAQRLLIRNVNKNMIAMSLALELVHPTGAGFDAERMPR